MIFKSELVDYKGLKRGDLKLTIVLCKEEAKKILPHIPNFMDKPLEININIDGERQLEKMKQINEKQRKKIFAMYRDIAEFVGDTPDNVRADIQAKFMELTEWSEEFSLSNAPTELASDLIDFIIQVAFEFEGMQLSESPTQGLGLDDTERVLRLCIKYKRCAICGKYAQIHHYDTIGMGGNRKTLDDSGHRKIALCNEHHRMAHDMGKDSFEAKYHVFGVVME